MLYSVYSGVTYIQQSLLSNSYIIRAELCWTYECNERIVHGECHYLIFVLLLWPLVEGISSCLLLTNNKGAIGERASFLVHTNNCVHLWYVIDISNHALSSSTLNLIKCKSPLSAVVQQNLLLLLLSLLLSLLSLLLLLLLLFIYYLFVCFFLFVFFYYYYSASKGNAHKDMMIYNVTWGWGGIFSIMDKAKIIKLLRRMSFMFIWCLCVSQCVCSNSTCIWGYIWLFWWWNWTGDVYNEIFNL
jgi:hypothetical protein